MQELPLKKHLLPLSLKRSPLKPAARRSWVDLLLCERCSTRERDQDGAVRASPTARVRLWGSRRQPPAAREASDVVFVCVHVLPAHGKHRFVCLSQAGSVEVLVNGALPPRPCRALLSLGKDLASIASFPLPAVWPSPSALALFPTRALKAGTALQQPL